MGGRAKRHRRLGPLRTEDQRERHHGVDGERRRRLRGRGEPDDAPARLRRRRRRLHRLERRSQRQLRHLLPEGRRRGAYGRGHAAAELLGRRERDGRENRMDALRGRRRISDSSSCALGSRRARSSKSLPARPPGDPGSSRCGRRDGVLVHRQDLRARGNVPLPRRRARRRRAKDALRNGSGHDAGGRGRAVPEPSQSVQSVDDDTVLRERRLRPSRSRYTTSPGASCGASKAAAPPTGPRAVEWNGLDDRGNRSGAGMYLCRLRAGKETLSRKMILLR